MNRHVCKPNSKLVQSAAQACPEPSDEEPSFHSDEECEAIFSQKSESDDLVSDCLDENLSDSSDNEEEMVFIDEFLEEENDYQSGDQYSQDTDHLYLVSFFKILLKWQALFFVSDHALSFLLLFFRSMLYILSATSTLATELYRKFPSNIYQLNKFISFDKDVFHYMNFQIVFIWLKVLRFPKNVGMLYSQTML